MVFRCVVNAQADQVGNWIEFFLILVKRVKCAYNIVLSNLFEIWFVYKLEDSYRLLVLSIRISVSEYRQNQYRPHIFHVCAKIINTGLEGGKFFHVICVNQLSRLENFPSNSESVRVHPSAPSFQLSLRISHPLLLRKFQALHTFYFIILHLFDLDFIERLFNGKKLVRLFVAKEDSEAFKLEKAW